MYRNRRRDSSLTSRGNGQRGLESLSAQKIKPMCRPSCGCTAGENKVNDKSNKNVSIQVGQRRGDEAERSLATDSIGHRELCPIECYEEDFLQSRSTAASPLVKSHGPTAKSPGPRWRPPQAYTYGADFNPAAIPHRQWLLGHRRALGEVTVDIGPPGVNKSSLILIDAVAIVTGRTLLADVPYSKGDVLLFAGEDSRRDVEAKLAGILAYYEIPTADLGGRLHVVYLAEVDPLAYSFAQMLESAARINRELLDWIKSFPNLVAALIDPVAAWHLIIENDTSAMKVLCTELRRTAVAGNIHIGFDHHITKATMSDPEGHVGNLAAARGAYIAADARWAFTLAKLRQQTANEFGISAPDQPRYRRLDSLKASYGPDDVETRLLQVRSVTIANGESVAVLSEGDTQLIRAEALEKKVAAQADRKEALTQALTKMLEESTPRSADGAATWLQTHRPELFPGRRGQVLSTRSIRESLPIVIGGGLNTRCRGRPDCIVCRTSGVGKGARWEISFAQIEMV
jgi:hypothetical protein